MANYLNMKKKIHIQITLGKNKGNFLWNIIFSVNLAFILKKCVNFHWIYRCFLQKCTFFLNFCQISPDFPHFRRQFQYPRISIFRGWNPRRWPPCVEAVCNGLQNWRRPCCRVKDKIEVFYLTILVWRMLQLLLI